MNRHHRTVWALWECGALPVMGDNRKPFNYLLYLMEVALDAM